MRKQTTETTSESRPEWDTLEQLVQRQDAGPGPTRSRRRGRSDTDNDSGNRNGYAKPRKLTLSSGTIEVSRPTVRNTEGKFESRPLPLFTRRANEVSELIPQLYLHGLSEGDFYLGVRGLLGDDAPVSAATVARLKDKWNIELAEWRSRRLDELEVVYIWVDGVYVKAGLEREKAAILVVIAALSDGSKRVLSAEPGYRESVESWSETLRSLFSRWCEERGHESESMYEMASNQLSARICPRRLGLGPGHFRLFQLRCETLCRQPEKPG